ncbi:MAG: SDR family oxidoreductase [Armatimonadetes bacterium]|nr:SDR family oxidoreductase [Armatimonadota bacterium]
MILLTGASGYVGGRLLARLAKSGHKVRCLVRGPRSMPLPDASSSEVAQGDALDLESLEAAMAGVETAYYLIHSMAVGPDFEERDRRCASNFAEAAAHAGVRKIVYLGGLSNDEGELSSHFRSRLEVGELLRSTGVPVIEFRASVIIGSGSLSFELIRALVERLPAMVAPRWVQMPAQPIGIEDVLDYLVEALSLNASESRVYEIGGPEVVTYQEMMLEYARQRGLRRWIIPVPVLTPHLSSLWLGLVTPIYARVGRMLIESIRYASVVRRTEALADFSVRPHRFTEAVALAMRNEDREFAESRWSDSFGSSGTRPTNAIRRYGNRLVDSRSVHVECSAQAAFRPIREIGGARGWYGFDWLWNLRAAIDLVLGGVGKRRGRRHPDQLVVGDFLDWWRVERIEPDRLLLLAAEMKLPGRAWLQFEVQESDSGCTIRLTAIFDPVGVAGLAYWYLVYPLHQVIFRTMLDGIRRRVLACPGRKP